MLAMHRAVDALAIRPEFVVVDGNRLPNWDYSGQSVVKGDQRISCISAASIIAKVTRDRDMADLASVYPDYGFSQHKGYPTALHKAALARYGASDQHRKTFEPVNDVGCSSLLTKNSELLPILIVNSIPVVGNVRFPGIYPIGNGVNGRNIFNLAGGFLYETLVSETSFEVGTKYDGFNNYLFNELLNLNQVTFFNSTKFPILVFSFKIVLPLILAKGPIDTFFLIEQFSK